jgi:hypothetical protein
VAWDVDDRDVGPSRVDHAQEGLGVAAAPRDLEAGILEQPRKPLPEQRLVVGDHNAHGRSTRRP